MSRKDYILIAHVLHGQRVRLMGTVRSGSRSMQLSTWECMARALCTSFARDNPRFDQARFMRAARDGTMTNPIQDMDARCGPKTGCSDADWSSGT